MHDKLTDSEIVKALEWCEQFENNIVSNWISDNRYIFALQTLKTIKNVLKDFNRLQAEHDNYSHNVRTMTKAIRENQVLISELVNTCKKLKAKNEKLKEELKILSQKRFNIFERVEYVGKIKSETKAEAYKDILNFLECRFVCKGKLTAFGYESAIIDIKNHLKELEEE